MDIDHNKPRGESPFDNKLPKRETPRHLSFGSKTEYACGVLLEKYVPGFELEMGDTISDAIL